MMNTFNIISSTPSQIETNNMLSNSYAINNDLIKQRIKLFVYAVNRYEKLLEKFYYVLKGSVDDNGDITNKIILDMWSEYDLKAKINILYKRIKAETKKQIIPIEIIIKFEVIISRLNEYVTETRFNLVRYQENRGE